MAGNLRGVSAEQDSRFKNKEKKLLKSMKFPAEFSQKVDLSKVQWAAMKPWIAKRLTELLGGLEDDVLIGYVYEQLEWQREVDPRILQINLTGFLEKNASLFTKELWNLLLSANQSPSGIPQQFLDEKAEELRQKEEERRRIQQRLDEERRRQDDRAMDRNRRRDTRSRSRSREKYSSRDKRRRSVSPRRDDRRRDDRDKERRDRDNDRGRKNRRSSRSRSTSRRRYR